jgi:hypothetical protein
VGVVVAFLLCLSKLKPSPGIALHSGGDELVVVGVVLCRLVEAVRLGLFPQDCATTSSVFSGVCIEVVAAYSSEFCVCFSGVYFSTLKEYGASLPKNVV